MIGEDNLGLSPVMVRFVDQGTDLATRIELSCGTRPVDAHEIETGGYEPDARLPREPWRPITPSEAAYLQSSGAPLDWSRAIIVLGLPLTVTDSFRRALVGPEQPTVAAAFLDLLRALCIVEDPVWIGASHNPPNLKSVTVDSSIGKRIGLHVDAWDRLPPEALGRASNRISFNIGREDRYLVFIPHPVTEIAELVKDRSELRARKALNSTSIARCFMGRYPEVPVVRCRLAPGEGYIAPTENLIHDGSSEGQREGDRQVTTRGRIRLY